MRGRRLYQVIARASAENAESLLADSRSADRRGHKGHACALRILAIEEAVKAIIYKHAAEGIVRFVKRGPNNVSTYSETELRDHKFKHGSVAAIIVGAIEFHPFQAALISTRKEQFTRLDVERLLHRAYTSQWVQRSELAREGRPSRELNSTLQTLGRMNDLKNDGLYVGSAKGSVKRPDEIARKELKNVRELSSFIVPLSSQLVTSAEFTPQRRRILTQQTQALAAQARRVRRLAAKRVVADKRS